jgi:DNA-binding transcriptional MocR family regulator
MNPSYDLAVNLPLRTAVADRLARSLHDLPVSAAMLQYPPMAGSLAVREAMAGWMRLHTGHGAVDPRRLVVTLGARHALALALDETCGPGDTLLMESLTYHGFRSSAEARGVRVTGVTMDAEGMRPDDLDRVATAIGARTVYIQPTLQNPTTATMPLGRRQDILAVAAKHDLTIIEGDVYSPLAWHGGDALPALADLDPARCLHAGGIGKILGPGLRIGWLLLPDDASHQRAAESIRLTTDGLPALLPSVVAGWMADGTADDLLNTLVVGLRERHRLARSLLGSGLVGAKGLHVWLPADDAPGIEARARARGVSLTPSRALAADGQDARGIRIALGAEEDPDRLEAALRIVASCL